MYKTVLLVQFFIHNNEVRDMMMILLSTNKIYKQIKVMNPHNIYLQLNLITT